MNQKLMVRNIKDFIREYVEKSNTTGIIMGLSGGVDSAVVATLCIRAIGIDKVLCIYMPTDKSSKVDEGHVNLLAKKFNLEVKTIDITNIYNEFDINNLKKTTAGNIAARIRMIILYKFANEYNRLVCGTSNKTELLLGYFTKYGDGGVDIEPIANLYKTQVWELAKYLKIPPEIISKPPSAGLWEGQTDEGELGIKYIEVDRILKMIENSEHKRNPIIIPRRM